MEPGEMASHSGLSLRQICCLDNLRQLGIALHHHHAALKAFPGEKRRVFAAQRQGEGIRVPRQFPIPTGQWRLMLAIL